MLLTSKRPLDRPLAIRHVNVVPMESERVLHDHTVVIEDGRIQAIGPTAEFGDAPAETVNYLDARGKYLLPGLADMHIHLWDPGEAALFLANGVTLVRNMTGAPLHLANAAQARPPGAAWTTGDHHHAAD